MYESSEILRSWAQAVQRLSGAQLVSVFVPPAPGCTGSVLLHEGAGKPVPELAHTDVAAQFLAETKENGIGQVYLSPEADSVLVRIPSIESLPHFRDPATPLKPRPDKKRRRTDSTPHYDPDGAWLRCDLCDRFFQYRRMTRDRTGKREDCPFGDCTGIAPGLAWASTSSCGMTCASPPIRAGPASHPN